jgi:hypothetical protein
VALLGAFLKCQFKSFFVLVNTLIGRLEQSNANSILNGAYASVIFTLAESNPNQFVSFRMPLASLYSKSVDSSEEVRIYLLKVLITIE